MPNKFESSKKSGSILFVGAVIILLGIFGCQQKSEKPVNTTAKETQNAENNPEVSQQSSGKGTTTDESISLTGKWTGILDHRSTILLITKQDGNNFSGKITINYREPIHQDVSGKVDPSTMKIMMEDQLHSRNKGRYTGKISNDRTQISGTFTVNLTKANYSFNLTKK